MIRCIVPDALSQIRILKLNVVWDFVFDAILPIMVYHLHASLCIVLCVLEASSKNANNITKIYELLLPSSEEIKIPWETIDMSTNEPSTNPHIFVSILQTCKKVNEEATPILYHNNTFITCLRMSPHQSIFTVRWYTPAIEPSLCFLRNFRWSTISMIPKLSFTSSSVPLPGPILPGTPYVRPSFSCSGKEVLERFVASDFRYSPVGPDMSMALSISNWVSVNVMRVEMNAIQRELEAIIGPNEALLALLSENQTDWEPKRNLRRIFLFHLSIVLAYGPSWAVALVHFEGLELLI